MRILDGHVGIGISIVTVVVFCSMAFGVAQTQISHNSDAISDVDDRNRKDHDILLQIERDVKWLRSKFDKEFE